ncbi:hypothetical protein I4U23_016306 [Adineta vaga]|nr:hypothetical protein I4U23_016306 [Adineta vaga]
MMVNNNDQSGENKKVSIRFMRPFAFPKERLVYSVDLRHWMPPIDDQKGMNTCSATTFATLCNYLFKRLFGYDITVSRLFIYYNSQIMYFRTLEVEDIGAHRMNVALSLRKYGVCEEKYWPYQKYLLNKMPSDLAYEQASHYAVTPFYIPINVNAIEMCLNNKLPVVIGIRLTNDAARNMKYNGGYLQVPDINNSLVYKSFLHSCLIVGYDKNSQYFICRNSWGRNWGDQGYFYMPYEYISHSTLVNDRNGLWSIMKIIPRTNTLPTVRRLVVS